MAFAVFEAMTIAVGVAFVAFAADCVTDRREEGGTGTCPGPSAP